MRKALVLAAVGASAAPAPSRPGAIQSGCAGACRNDPSCSRGPASPNVSPAPSSSSQVPTARHVEGASPASR